MNVMASRNNLTPDHPMEFLHDIQRRRAGRARKGRWSSSHTRYSDNISNGATALCPELTWLGSDDDLAISHESSYKRSPHYSYLYNPRRRMYNIDNGAKERKREKRDRNDTFEGFEIIFTVLWRAVRWAIAISLAGYISSTLLIDDAPQRDTRICGSNVLTTPLRLLGYCLPEQSREEEVHIIQSQPNDSKHPITKLTSDLTISSGPSSLKTSGRSQASTSLASSPLGKFHNYLAYLYDQADDANDLRDSVHGSKLGISEVSTLVRKSNLTDKEAIYLSLQKVDDIVDPISESLKKSFDIVQKMVDSVNLSNKPALQKWASMRQNTTEKGLSPDNSFTSAERKVAREEIHLFIKKLLSETPFLIAFLEIMEKDLGVLQKQCEVVTELRTKESHDNWQHAMAFPVGVKGVLQVVGRWVLPAQVLLPMQLAQLLEKIEKFQTSAMDVTIRSLRAARDIQTIISQAEKQYGRFGLNNTEALDEAVIVLTQFSKSS